MPWTEGEHAKTVAGAINPVNVLHIMMNALHAASEATGRNAAGKAGNRDSNALDEAKEASLPHHNTDMIDSGAPGNTTNSGASPTSIP